MSATLAGCLRVEAVFTVHGDDEAAAYAALTELIDRLNQVANLPECECDLDISVEQRSRWDGRRADPGRVPVPEPRTAAAGL